MSLKKMSLFLLLQIGRAKLCYNLTFSILNDIIRKHHKELKFIRNVIEQKKNGVTELPVKDRTKIEDHLQKCNEKLKKIRKQNSYASFNLWYATKLVNETFLTFPHSLLQTARMIHHQELHYYRQLLICLVPQLIYFIWDHNLCLRLKLLTVNQKWKYMYNAQNSPIYCYYQQQMTPNNLPKRFT